MLTQPTPASARTTGSTRRSSSATEGRTAPGRVDSPPTSTMSAPWPIRSWPWAMAASGSNHSPAVGERVRGDVDHAHHQGATGLGQAGNVAGLPACRPWASRRGFKGVVPLARTQRGPSARVYALLVSDLRPGPPAGAGPPPRSVAGQRCPRLLGTAAAAVLVVLLGNQAVDFFQIDSDTNPAGSTGTPLSEPDVATTSASPKATARRRRPAAAPRPPPGPKPAPRPNRSLTQNSLYDIDLDGARVACGITVRSPKPPLRNADLASVHALAGELHGQGVRQATGRPGVHADQAQGQGVPGLDQVAVRPVRPEGRARVLLLGEPDHLLAGDPGRRPRGVHLRPAGLRRSRRPRVRPSPAGATGMVNEYGRRYGGRHHGASGICSAGDSELQAQCFEGVFLQTVARSIEAQRRRPETSCGCGTATPATRTRRRAAGPTTAPAQRRSAGWTADWTARISAAATPGRRRRSAVKCRSRAGARAPGRERRLSINA